MSYIAELHEGSEDFRMFTDNQGVGSSEIKAFNAALLETAPFNATTLRSMEVLAENKRLNFIKEVAQKYRRYYAAFNKEEKITIISAEPLTTAQEGEVLAALQANPANEGKAFTIEYQVDSAIVGGLQMYTESEFMDMSLASRVGQLQAEVAKMCN